MEPRNIILLVMEYLQYHHNLKKMRDVQINGMSLSPALPEYDVVYTIPTQLSSEIVAKIPYKKLEQFKAIKRRDKINIVLNAD